MLSGIYIKKISDKQTVKSPDVHSSDMQGPVAMFINKSHPNINAYMGELSPVVVVPYFLKSVSLY